MIDTQTVSPATAVCILFLAAVLEAGGDALVRYGLHARALRARLALFALGGIVLFCYGYVVNAPGWDFGRLLGVYVVFFFLVAQAIAWLAYGQLPSRSLIVGGALIVAGGAIISIWPQ
jgi:drug/metabolite transporter superfamily protein YnfA